MDSKIYRSITECRICGSGDLGSILDLGQQPPANSLRSDRSEELPHIPLVIKRCNHCSSVQLGETVSPEYLFRHYVWVTGTSSTARNYSLKFSEEAIKRAEKKNKLFVVEIASNDGTFLEPFKNKGHEILGVDPARNIAEIANGQGIPTIADFFGLSLAKKISVEYGKADCVFARNVIPHVENVHDVIQGMVEVLSDGGLGIIEFHYSKIILDELHYDSIYHEHYLYHSLYSINFLLKKYGFYSFDLIESPISGGSLVIYFKKSQMSISKELENKIENENLSGVNTLEKWLQFAQNCQTHKVKLKRIIDDAINNGSKIIGYGASARSSTLLNYCGINSSHLICIADQSGMKHDKYTPGTDILVVPPMEAFSHNPDVLLLLAWNFKDEILSIIKDKYNFKGTVVIPLPHDIDVITI